MEPPPRSISTTVKCLLPEILATILAFGGQRWLGMGKSEDGGNSGAVGGGGLRGSGSGIGRVPVVRHGLSSCAPYLSCSTHWR